MYFGNLSVEEIFDSIPTKELEIMATFYPIELKRLCMIISINTHMRGLIKKEE
tara:strand:+ start:854 stop:1012 length:159 start_codon:yes stop_codon:yes gene_type:complete